jgi:hypothetical protein
MRQDYRRHCYRQHAGANANERRTQLMILFAAAQSCRRKSASGVAKIDLFLSEMFRSHSGHVAGHWASGTFTSQYGSG